ncbi:MULTISPECIES: IS30 family transposase [unclassified Legionella]|uniref:IS30 family transposase n=1 Tax=unclassified Legionella TaxID=2622702 RepID=UPI001E4FAF70|nr:IS30 family transposase [Legionella sp. 31fI33]MCC5014859.1 IS30 family transposase [Legionella sp. 31fI33]
MSHKQLTREQRYHIYGLWRSGYSQMEIAKELGVHKSTICRELSRNSRWNGYFPEQAQCFSEMRRKGARKRIIFTKEIEEFVREHLLKDWSPDQISGYAKKHNLFMISHERIYQYVLQDKKQGGKLYLHLRHQSKKYRKRYGSPKRNSPIKNRIFIDDRPKIVDSKTRVGDWEIDTIIGKNRKEAIITLVERVSKMTLCKKINSRKAAVTRDATISILKPFDTRVFTITGDNGVEFAEHEAISQNLAAQFYFAHPYASWERGLNENTNGLIRQYLKKGSDFKYVTDKDIYLIMDKLNSRPRKNLGYATPNEIFFG